MDPASESAPPLHIIGMARVSTPCLRVCLLDAESGLCEGCGRTRDEIARWGSMTEADRLAIMRDLDRRMREAFAADLTRAETRPD